MQAIQRGLHRRKLPARRQASPGNSPVPPRQTQRGPANPPPPGQTSAAKAIARGQTFPRR